jgi:hypothetical protein
MKIENSVGMVALALLCGACSGSSSPSTQTSGGSTGTSSQVGGSTSNGTGANCTSVTPCGGDVVGSWDVTSSCLNLSGNFVSTGSGLGCDTVPLTGTLQVKGSFAFTADMQFQDNTTTTGDATVILDRQCLFMSGTWTTCDLIPVGIENLGFSNVSCVDAAGGGCTCQAKINQSGTMGLIVASAENSGQYTASGNTIVTGQNPFTAVDLAYPYCVANGNLTMTPKTSGMTTTGSVVFQKRGGSGGSGGSSGIGGSVATGGVVGTGGIMATGGVTGAGGSNDTGGKVGTTGTGGKVGGGGSPTTGGITGLGGGVGTGGVVGTGGATTAGGATGAGGSSSTGGKVSTTATGGRVGTGGATTAGGATATGGATTSAGGSTAANGPCDILAAANTPCVAAYSVARAIYKAYSGPVYQVRSKTNTSSVKDIPLLTTGGYVDSSVQDTFCATGGCTVSKIYDQSPKANHLALSPDTYWLTLTGTPRSGGGLNQKESDVSKNPKINVGGHPVYGLRFTGGQGNAYRVLKPSGTATGDQAEYIYAIFDTTVYNGSCCNDFGSAETTGNPDSFTSMEAIYYGNATMWGKGGGNGPWFSCDYEATISPGATKVDTSIPSINISKFATFILKGFSGDRIALKFGDAQQGALTTQYDGSRADNGSPMHKQGSIILGTGGDGSAWSNGVWYEGVMTMGCPDDKAVDDAIQANIVAAGYGK